MNEFLPWVWGLRSSVSPGYVVSAGLNAWRVNAAARSAWVYDSRKTVGRPFSRPAAARRLEGDSLCPVALPPFAGAEYGTASAGIRPYLRRPSFARIAR